MAYPVQLQSVSANQAVYWVINSFKTFFTQPLMLGGLVFMCSAILQLLLAITPIGLFLALLLVPVFNIAAIAAMEDATHGRMAKPNRIITAFKGGSSRTKAVLALGGFYILGIVLLSIITYIGFNQEIIQFAEAAKQNMATASGASSQLANTAASTSSAAATVSPENLNESVFNFDNGLPNFLIFMIVCSLISSLAFWHAPSLVFWYGVKPFKAMIFSFVACIKNIKAMLVYAACWVVLIAPIIFLSNLIISTQGENSFLSFLIMPLMMVASAVLVLSNYFTFKGTFVQYVELDCE